MTALLGIDCATVPTKTGLALGELRDGRVHIEKWKTGEQKESAADIALEWLAGWEGALIALDAPLGWPRAFGPTLASHRAGLPLRVDKGLFFKRATDQEIAKRKVPLEVTANLIARTAFAALELLAELRERTGRSIPLAWTAKEAEPWRAIEVYPAATRLAHGAKDKGRILEDLGNVLDCSKVLPGIKSSEHGIDAAVCALAAGDFLQGKVKPPENVEIAKIEGWIWAPGEPEMAGKL